MAGNYYLTIFLLSCAKDDVFYDTTIYETGLLGDWFLNKTYISPSGATEWKDVD